MSIIYNKYLARRNRTADEKCVSMLIELLNKWQFDEDSAVCLKGNSFSVALEGLSGILKMDVIPSGGQNVSISLTPRSL